MMPTSTHRDWNPRNVDLLTCCNIADFCGIPVEHVWQSIMFDPSFPPYHRDAQGRRCGDYRTSMNIWMVCGEKRNPPGKRVKPR